MKKCSRRFLLLRALICQKSYTLSSAIPLLKQISNTKFIESVEAHISLNIDPKYANQQFRASLVLPNGTGKFLQMAVLCESSLAKEMLDYGAAFAGDDDLLEMIALGKCQFDVLITTPELMPKLAKLGRILGPKGLMPSPKSGTVTHNIRETINEFKKGKLEYRADKTGVVHLSFGKANFTEAQLKENLLAVYASIEKNKPSGVKGKYFKCLNICTTMSPGLRIDLNSF